MQLGGREGESGEVDCGRNEEVAAKEIKAGGGERGHDWGAETTFRNVFGHYISALTGFGLCWVVGYGGWPDIHLHTSFQTGGINPGEVWAETPYTRSIHSLEGKGGSLRG